MEKETILVVPFGHGAQESDQGTYLTHEGLVRVKYAFEYAAALLEKTKNNKVVKFVIGVNKHPRSGIDVGSLMASHLESYMSLDHGTFFREQISQLIISRNGEHGAWGTFAQAEYALSQAEDRGVRVVFVSSWYHMPRIRLACKNILKEEYVKWLRSGQLVFEGCGTLFEFNVLCILREYLFALPTEWLRRFVPGLSRVIGEWT